MTPKASSKPPARARLCKLRLRRALRGLKTACPLRAWRKAPQAQQERTTMAVLFFDISVHSRSRGHSAIAASAYASGSRMTDSATGRVYDYTGKKGVLHEYSSVEFPQSVKPMTREELWNFAESLETRANSTILREWKLGLPYELTHQQNAELAKRFARVLTDRYGIAVQVDIHIPHKTRKKNGQITGADARNVHAHLRGTTRSLIPVKSKYEKTRVLDSQKTGAPEINQLRELWVSMMNEALSGNGHDPIPPPMTGLGGEALRDAHRITNTAIDSLEKEIDQLDIEILRTDTKILELKNELVTRNEELRQGLDTARNTASSGQDRPNPISIADTAGRYGQQPSGSNHAPRRETGPSHAERIPNTGRRDGEPYAPQSPDRRAVQGIRHRSGNPGDSTAKLMERLERLHFAANNRGYIYTADLIEKIENGEYYHESAKHQTHHRHGLRF